MSLSGPCGFQVGLSCRLFLSSNGLHASFVRVYKSLARSALLVLLDESPLRPFPPGIGGLLQCYLLLELLHLLNSADQAVLEVLLDVGRDHVDIMICIINFAIIKLVLDEGRQLLVVVLAIAGI